MNEEPRISVALVTRNRPESLRRCLESLRAQSAQPWEVIVSDDSDAENSADSREVARLLGCRWMAGPRRGLYANRNAAALACAGTHLRTMDDDHTFPEGHFSRCLEAVRKDPRAIWTTGETRLSGGRLLDEFDTAGQLHPSGLASAVADPDDNWAVADGSTIYPAEIFQRGFRMTEAFSFGSSYLEFGALLFRHGWKSRCISGALIEHHLETAPQPREAASQLFACLCFNLRFKPSRARLLRHALPIIVRNPQLALAMPRLFRLVKERWGAEAA